MKIKMYSSIISIKLNGEEDKEIFAITFNNIEELDKYLNGTKPLKSHRLCDNIECQPGAGLTANAITFWTNYMSQIITFDQFKK